MSSKTLRSQPRRCISSSRSIPAPLLVLQDLICMQMGVARNINELLLICSYTTMQISIPTTKLSKGVNCKQLLAYFILS